ncbi:WD40/YVTN/BNR-like repeat-containing protein [Siccirubricoccus phaeus]|uniref:WD40/YVTN/BNR-like repeat-containing protein n=1 Tax=Siccirubricoccus phaeus TaxID=2595053 RepID=UPI00165C93A0|nr:hypothetical protein [Siccirubricoccus phaeus]
MDKGQVFAGVVRWPGGANMASPPDTLGGVFRLNVGESEWEHVTRGLPAECHVPCVSVDPHDPRRVFAGTQEGPYVSTDAGSSWHRLDFPLRDRQVWAIAVHPRDPRKLYVGTSPLGVFISEDDGGTWREAPTAALPDPADMRGFVNRVLRFAFNPARPEEMFAALEVRGVIRSTDGGETWQDCGQDLIRLSEQPHLQSAIITTNTAEGMLDAHAVAISPAAPETPLVALRMGLFRSEDHGAHWQDFEMRKLSPIFYGRDIRVSPHDPNTLYATLSTAANGATGTVWRSTDLGRSWARFDTPTRARSTMMAAAPSPRDAGVVYAAARKGEIFATLDGGASWQEVPLPQGCLGVMALAVN